MGAHEDLPFTGWGCDDPETFPRPAERPATAPPPAVPSPAAGGGRGRVWWPLEPDADGIRWLPVAGTLSEFERESIRMSLRESRPDAITVLTDGIMPVVNP